MSVWQVLSNVLYIFTPLSTEETGVGEVKLLIPAGKRQGWDLKPGVSASHCRVSVNEATGCCCFLVSSISLGPWQSLPEAVLWSGPWQGCQAQPQSSLSWAVSDCSYSASLCPGVTLGVWISYFFITDCPQTAQKWAVLLMLAGLARVSVVSWQVTWGLEGLGRLHACVQHWDVCLLEWKRENGSCVSPHPAGYSGLFLGSWARFRCSKDASMQRLLRNASELAHGHFCCFHWPQTSHRPAHIREVGSGGEELQSHVAKGVDTGGGNEDPAILAAYRTRSFSGLWSRVVSLSICPAHWGVERTCAPATVPTSVPWVRTLLPTAVPLWIFLGSWLLLIISMSAQSLPLWEAFSNYPT